MAKIGRPLNSATDGRMRNFSIRVPYRVRVQMEFVFKHGDYRSLSHVAVAALEEYLPDHIAIIEKALSRQYGVKK